MNERPRGDAVAKWRVPVVLLPFLAAAPFAALLAGQGPAEGFTGHTLRADLFHTGTAEQEIVALDRVRAEGPWPGSWNRLLDTTGLGKYFFEIVDTATAAVLFTRGYSSIYGEWETTGEARAGTFRTFEESLRFPEPERPFELVLSKRGADGGFQVLWRTTIEPQSRFVDRSPIAPRPVRALFENGPPARKVDLLFLGDGYVAAEMEKFHADAERLAGVLFATEPFAARRGDFNVRAVETPARESGVSRPRAGVFRDSPLGAAYNALDSERYVLSLRERQWREAAAVAPYEFVVLLINDRKYGGGGIYGLYSTVAADSAFSPYLLVHEFGHHFAGLGDEYYTSAVAYEQFTGSHSEPWEPNVTALLDPAALKWRELVSADVPLPTPWGKERYEEESRAIQKRRHELREAGAPESEVEELFRAERELFTALLGAEPWAGRVGAFEGALYEANGLYRPAVDCVMFTRDEVGFCPVCRAAVERVIDLYSE